MKPLSFFEKVCDFFEKIILKTKCFFWVHKFWVNGAYDVNGDLDKTVEQCWVCRKIKELI